MYAAAEVAITIKKLIEIVNCISRDIDYDSNKFQERVELKEHFVK